MKPNEQYQTLQQAYDWFNEQLFGNALPNCLITLHGKSDRQLGYYSPERFNDRTDKTNADELALNPATAPVGTRTNRSIALSNRKRLCIR